MLKLENISAGYEGKQVLNDITFNIQKGDIILLSGGNGSGKSTLLKAIFGLIPLWSGNVFLNDEDITKLNPSQKLAKRISYIPQKDFLFENLTVEENLKCLDFDSNSIFAQDILKHFNLVNKLKKKSGLLSGGEKKILSYAMSLLMNPEIILFDEPLAGVDNVMGKIIFDHIYDQNKQKKITFLIIEHKKSFIIPTKEINLYLGRIQNN